MGEETDLAFLQACRDGDYDVAEHLLHEITDINLRDVENDGETPLYYASRYGHIHIVELLLTSGADVDAGDYNHISPLIIATQMNRMDIVDMLMAAGANLDMRSTAGTAAIHIAAEYNRTEIAKDLVEHRANINLKTSDSETAVFIAANNGHRAMAKLLLNMGAKVSQVEYNAATVTIQRFFDNWKRFKNTRKVGTVLSKIHKPLPSELEGAIASYLSGTTGKEGVQHGPKRPRYATNYIGNQQREIEWEMDQTAGKRSRTRKPSKRSRIKMRQSRRR